LAGKSGRACFFAFILITNKTLDMVLRVFRLLSGVLLMSALLTACLKDTPTVFPQTEDYNSEIACRWFDEFRALTKVCPGFSPPVASRAFGYAGVALYESVVPGMPVHRSLKGHLNGLVSLPEVDPRKEYHWPSVVNAAMAETALLFYANMPPASYTQVVDLEMNIRLGLEQGLDSETAQRSREFGKAVAQAVYEWSKTDGGHQGYLTNFPQSYTPPIGLGLWKPTPPAFQRAMQPYWGANRSFVPNSIPHSQPQAPPAYSTATNSVFYQQAMEVYQTDLNLTPEQEKIAKFWSDDPGAGGTPPGHSISIATQVLRQEDANLALAAETYAKVGIAVADAFISCWKCKFDFNLLRPVTYIQEQIDPNWLPLLATPPFPEYTSGHSVQSGATAAVLTDLFGADYAFVDSTHIDRNDIDGSPRAYNSFMEAAMEAAISRLYGGIHYQEAINLGVTQGLAVGKSVNELPIRK
jgi:hypothetical protein